jgi:5-amino-6-(5-phosphoribosylamino)uracil reductase
MGERPWTVLSCAVSLDGYLDDRSPGRLVLSNDEDLARVDAVRATCDAILVGAATVRADDPRLLVRDPAARRRRVSGGLPEQPTKVTVTRSGDLDPGSRFFTCGGSARLVYGDSSVVPHLCARLGEVATVVDAGTPVSMHSVVHDLAERGVARLLVEGGAHVHTQLLTAGLADELHLVVAPFFVGDALARRFVGPGAFPWDATHRARLLEATPVGDVVLMRYDLSGSGAAR